MPESLKMLLVLTLISAMAGFGLSAMNKVTLPVIQENERLFTLRSINKVIPDAASPDPCKKYKPLFDNSPDQDVVCVNGFKIYRARKGSEIVAVAIEAIGEEAYSGTIGTLVGLSLEGKLLGVEVLRHAETPGLGSLITECHFQQQMVGKGLTDINWSVQKDGGDIDQLSGATISSRSLLNAIQKAQRLIQKKKTEVLTADPIPSAGSCDAQ